MRYRDIPKDKRRQLTVQVIRESKALQALQVSILLVSIFLGRHLGEKTARIILEPDTFWGDVFVSATICGAIAFAALKFILMPMVKRGVLKKLQPNRVAGGN